MKQQVVLTTGPGLQGMGRLGRGQNIRSSRQKEQKETVPLEVAAGFTRHVPGAGRKLRHLAGKEVTMRSIIYAYADSLWQEMTEFVNAFVILYRAEVI